MRRKNTAAKYDLRWGPGVVTRWAIAGLAVEQQGAFTILRLRARLLWRFPYLERVEGIRKGVRGGPVGPPRSP